MRAINKDGLTLGFDLQKAVAMTYALINLVTSNKLISSKATTSIASRSLTMTDQQPNKPTLTQPNQRLNQKPIPGSTNHVSVHVAHDREHG
jgi:hypothetical protein